MDPLHPTPPPAVLLAELSRSLDEVTRNMKTAMNALHALEAQQYVLQPVEKERAAAFQVKHRHKVKRPGPRPRGFTMCYTPTGIGVRVDITCSWCSKSEDVSDYDGW